MFERVKTAVRDRLMRAVEDATSRRFDDLHREADDLRRQVALLADGFDTAQLQARRDVFIASERLAVDTSADYMSRHFAGAQSTGDPIETLRLALEAAPTGGLALEFGVYSGRTLGVIAAGRDETVYGFDVFTGLPEDWRPGFRAGTFQVDDLPSVDGAELVVGLFEDTLPGFLGEHPGPIDLMHVDCDLYSATVTVLTHTVSRLRVGSIVAFDEYYNHPNWQNGEHKAWLELVEQHGLSYEYIAFTGNNEQVVVRVTDVPGQGG